MEKSPRREYLATIGTLVGGLTAGCVNGDSSTTPPSNNEPTGTSTDEVSDTERPTNKSTPAAIQTDWEYDFEADLVAMKDAGDVVYIGDGDQNIHAINSESGEREWYTTYESGPEDLRLVSANGSVFEFNTLDYSLVAYDGDGGARWEYENDERYAVQYPSITASEDCLYFSYLTDGFLKIERIGVDDGVVGWTKSIEIGVSPLGTPKLHARDGGGVLLGFSDNHSEYAILANFDQDGNALWSGRYSGNTIQGVVGGESGDALVLVDKIDSDKGGVMALNANGGVRWEDLPRGDPSNSYKGMAAVSTEYGLACSYGVVKDENLSQLEYRLLDEDSGEVQSKMKKDASQTAKPSIVQSDSALLLLHDFHDKLQVFHLPNGQTGNGDTKSIEPKIERIEAIEAASLRERGPRVIAGTTNKIIGYSIFN